MNSIYHSANEKDEQALHTGFLAQDVEKVANSLGYDFDGIHKPANDRDHYSLAYSQFIMPLVKAVQEQQVMIKNLQETNIQQQEMILSLEEQVKRQNLLNQIINSDNQALKQQNEKQKRQGIN